VEVAGDLFEGSARASLQFQAKEGCGARRILQCPWREIIGKDKDPLLSPDVDSDRLQVRLNLIDADPTPGKAEE
jgi:hypothetical protein